MIDAATDLFIAGKKELDLSMRKRRFLRERLREFHHDRDARFVVSTQQGCAIGRDEGGSQQLLKLWIRFHADRFLRVTRKLDDLAGIRLDHLGLNALTTRFWRRIQMSIECNRGTRVCLIGRNGYPNEGVVILVCIGIAHRFQFFNEHPAKVPLTGTAWVRFLLLVRGRIDLDIP